jgi:hypothetical protein
VLDESADICRGCGRTGRQKAAGRQTGGVEVKERRRREERSMVPKILDAAVFSRGSS